MAHRSSVAPLSSTPIPNWCADHSDRPDANAQGLSREMTTKTRADSAFIIDNKEGSDVIPTFEALHLSNHSHHSPTAEDTKTLRQKQEIKTGGYESEAGVFRRICQPSAAVETLEALHPVHHRILDELFRLRPSVVVTLNKYCYDFFLPRLYGKVDLNAHILPATVKSFLHGLSISNGRKEDAFKHVREICFYFPPLVYVPKGNKLPDGTRQMIPIARLKGVRTGYRHSWIDRPPPSPWDEEVPPITLQSRKQLPISTLPSFTKMTMSGYMGDYLFKGDERLDEEGYVSTFVRSFIPVLKVEERSPGPPMFNVLLNFIHHLRLREIIQHSIIEIPALPLDSRGKIHYESLCKNMKMVYWYMVARSSKYHKTHTQI
ncbi:hypothetical protein B9479_004839 [Cryptococcus floricola]|uniref:Uncharacterized protein n=1 Tax=Cryptococcus floricola TaxID=2591691 RepID=A0A5D3ASX4_9TREE|nr:hypothetical protein B9479_004839 [Cryptococcus floricola]